MKISREDLLEIITSVQQMLRDKKWNREEHWHPWSLCKKIEAEVRSCLGDKYDELDTGDVPYYCVSDACPLNEDGWCNGHRHNSRLARSYHDSDEKWWADLRQFLEQTSP